MSLFQSLTILLNIFAFSLYADNYICNNTNSCQDEIINCSTSETSCNIQCTSTESCKNTTIHCADNQDCITICSSPSSCDSVKINCPTNTNSIDTGSCTVNGTASNALINMQFMCNSQNPNLKCNILCNDDSTCKQATINGKNATAPLNINCSGPDACTDINIYCPPSSDQGKLCTVSGWKTLGSNADTVHTNMNIYAIDSWNDIDLTQYAAWVYNRSTMHCGNNYEYQCLIANAGRVLQWNCMDDTSQCYRRNESVFDKRCDNDYQCNGTTIDCEAGKPCNVWCTGINSCSQSVINCPDDQECNIICTGYQGYGACDSGTNTNGAKTIFNCPPNANCNIQCGVKEIEYADYGKISCRNGIVNCPENGECNVDIYGDTGFQNGQIHCNTATKCNVVCDRTASCQEAVFNGTETGLLDIKCMQNMDNSPSCNDMKILCPESDGIEKMCTVSGEGDNHNELELFCKNSWNDIDISNYSAMILSGSVSTMNCGYNEYNNSCLLSQGVELMTNSCFCDVGTTPFVISTTEIIKTSPDGTDWILIIAISIGCFFFVMLALFCTLWMKKDDDIIAYEIYREQQKVKGKQQSNKGQYDEVRNVEEEDEEKQVELPTTETQQ